MKLNQFLINLSLAFVLFGQSLLAQQNVPDDVDVAETRAKAEEGDAEAQCLLGYHYSVGKGVPKDMAESVKWFTKAAEQNLAAGQYNLGCCYHKGEGVREDQQESAKWFRKAAEQNFAEAQFELGVFYRRGIGVTQSDVDAVKWYRKAAEQNYARAQFNLALCCIRAIGMPQEDVEGYKWLSLAARQDFKEAKIALTQLETAMSEAKVAKGKRLADDWLKEFEKTLSPPPTEVADDDNIRPGKREPEVKAAVSYPQLSPTYSELSLRGISGSANKRLAMINNQTFAPGEKAKVKLGDKLIVVECKEIRDSSVVVKVDGEQETRELKLGK